MKQINISCGCSDHCDTKLEVKQDEEEKGNLLFTLRNEKYLWGLFISLTKADAIALAKFILKVYKE